MARPVRTLLASSSFVLVAAVWACSSDDPSAVTTPVSDGGPTPVEEDGATSARPDAASASPDAAPTTTTCEAACKTTDGKAAFLSTQPFDRAQFGIESADGGASQYYVEAFGGGDPQCPGQNTPDPKRVFIITKVPRGSSKQVFTKAADGITGALVDIEGTLLATPKPESATSMTLTVGAVDPASQWIAFDVDATFPSGTIKGHFYATRCAIFDG
jgi:hypothetical protein